MGFEAISAMSLLYPSVAMRVAAALSYLLAAQTRACASDSLCAATASWGDGRAVVWALRALELVISVASLPRQHASLDDGDVDGSPACGIGADEQAQVWSTVALALRDHDAARETIGCRILRGLLGSCAPQLGALVHLRHTHTRPHALRATGAS